jgi:hypothetical protein
MLINFEVKGAETEQWVSYGRPPNRMARTGWTSNTVKPREPLTITGIPSKYGKKTMLFVKLVRAAGDVIPLPDTVTSFATRRGLKPRRKAEAPVLESASARSFVIEDSLLIPPIAPDLL